MAYIAEAEAILDIPELNASIETPTLDASLGDIVITADKHYAYTQSVPSAEWVITHNLNKFPSVTIVDSAGTEVIGEVQYIDANSLKVKFIGAFSGKAYMN